MDGGDWKAAVHGVAEGRTGLNDFTFTFDFHALENKKKETKEGGTEFRPGKGILKREKFPNIRKPSHRRICAELWKHRGQHNREKK